MHKKEGMGRNDKAEVLISGISGSVIFNLK